MERFASLLGLFVMVGLAWLMSSHRGRVRWRLVAGGVLLQFILAALILLTWPGQALFEGIQYAFVKLIECADSGSKLLFGETVVEKDDRLNQFAFRALPTIIFFSSLMSVLYYFGVIQWVVRWMAVGLQKTLGTSGAETLSAAANVFVGQTEAPLVIRPYLADMTRSELMALMVGGFATVAGGVLAVYVGVYHIEAKHLLTASVISAPAALVVAKIMQPEMEQPKTLGTVVIDAPSEADNIVHAASMGAADGVKLAINVGAMLIAFLALIALINLIFAAMGSATAVTLDYLFGYEISSDWTLQGMLGYLFMPMAWLLGVESGDCLQVGQLLGIKMVANEFLAYEQLHAILPEGGTRQISERSEMLATYALCGFANFGSIGIQIGGIGPLAPKRKAELAQLGFRAMLGGTLAAFMTACIAGILL